MLCSDFVWHYKVPGKKRIGCSAVLWTVGLDLTRVYFVNHISKSARYVMQKLVAATSSLWDESLRSRFNAYGNTRWKRRLLRESGEGLWFYTRDQVWGYLACIYVLIYMIGGCALTVHCVAMTVQCIVHYCGKLQITTELRNCVLRTVQLCNDLGLLCSAREKRGKGYLPIRDRGWLRLGLRLLWSRLSALFRRPNLLFPLSQLFRCQVI